MLAIDNTNLETVEDESWEEILKLENNNNTLLDATLLALKTGNLAPLIKEDLKYTIQSRRYKQGQEELKVEIPKEKIYELTVEEKIKIDRRREQNRQAAHRFREKKKSTSSLLFKKIQEQEADNMKKTNEVKELRKEKEQLQKMLFEHLLVCPNAKQCIRFQP
ncbi:uncharacterized protein LOC143069647 [Mytilus galloprovincialis]|uniref:uncharacterized protein LOC143069647 n=1 Tax=Mytilus galloprovincialis TaxID=29158 RepID=UPI003F7BE82E